MYDCWINIEFKDYYNDSSKQGIYLHFAKGINAEVRKNCIDFVNFLRKLYFFPIKCNIYFSNQTKFRSVRPKKYCYGIFFPNQELKKKTFPSIYVPSKFIDRKNETLEEYIYSVLFTIVHEITHYFQWYFFADKKRSDRSLEIEANVYGRYLLDLWYESKIKTIR